MQTQDMLNVHQDAIANSTTILLHDLLLSYKEEKMVFGIIEGKDDFSFYKYIIKKNLPPDWDICIKQAGNKKKVIQFLESLQIFSFPANQICCFIDKDLSPHINEKIPEHKNLYVTDKYSIENNILDETIFFNIMEDITGHNFNSTDKKLIIEFFSTNLSLFSKMIFPVMAQIIITKRKYPNIDLELDNFKLSNLYIFQDGKMLQHDSNIQLNQVISSALQVELIDQKEIQDIIDKELENLEKEHLIRGKYLLKFFIDCFSEMCIVLKKMYEDIKFSMQIGKKNAVLLLAPRAQCPISLKSFIDLTYMNYIRTVV